MNVFIPPYEFEEGSPCIRLMHIQGTPCRAVRLDTFQFSLAENLDCADDSDAIINEVAYVFLEINEWNFHGVDSNQLAAIAGGIGFTERCALLQPRGTGISVFTGTKLKKAMHYFCKANASIAFAPGMENRTLWTLRVKIVRQDGTPLIHFPGCMLTIHTI